MIFTPVKCSECQCNDEHIHSTNQDGARTRELLSYVSELLTTGKTEKVIFQVLRRPHKSRCIGVENLILRHYTFCR